MGALSDVEVEFIGETLDILTQLCRSCGDLRGDESTEEVCEDLQRGLHTIRGNAPAFGFDEFGEVASVLLERLKAWKSGTPQEGKNIAPLVLEFVTRSRQYLGLVRDGRPRPFFGGVFKSLREKLVPPEQRLTDTEEVHGDDAHGGKNGGEPSANGGAAGESDRPGVTKTSTLAESLKAILATAPRVEPNVEQLAKLAARKLKLKSRPAVIDAPRRSVPANRKPDALAPKEPLVEKRDDPTPPGPAPAGEPVESAAPPPLSEVSMSLTEAAPPPRSEVPISLTETASKQVDTRVSGSDVAGLAFEALCAQAAASIVRAEIVQNADLDLQMTRVTAFLTNFCLWVRGQQLVPIQKFLDRCVDDLGSLATPTGLEIEISAERTNRLVLPALGELAARAVTELVRRLSLLWKRGEGRRSLTLSVAESSDRTEIRICGAGSSAALATRLRVIPVKKLLEEIGGDLLTGPPGEGLVVVLPDDLHSMNVCLLRTGASHVGIPGHRVIVTKTIQRDAVTRTDSGCRCVFDNQELTVLDLTDNSTGAAGDGPEEQCLVVLRGEREPHGLIVDELLGQEEMLVRLDRAVSQGGDLVGSCFAPSAERAVPLLDFKASRMETEGHTS